MNSPHFSASQEAFPPPLPNHLSPDYSPALTMMQQFQADLLRMDEEHLQRRDSPSSEIPSPFPDDDQTQGYGFYTKMRTWCQRRFSRRSRASDASAS
ncbi:hypothetical protein GMOD_00003506 [Pyrenophora seminiperda CCB06]|uniref:Uncharacterized protein n=1 Tax=Pyrenophora seminiperda CCB06 TaxID=1302712 RepID=A0A3M7MJ58_9PLEO|nr:hypothetical protein GMOD_00003506 [Pyrenophora seminiperda CCB06]